MSDEQPERVVARLRPHGRALILPAVLLWGVAWASMFLLGRVDWPIWNTIVLTVAALLIVLLCLVPTLAWLSRRSIITTRRVIVRGGFGGTRREVLLARIHDVSVRKTGMQPMFGSGDVLLSTGGERAIVLGDLPSASLVQRTLSELLDHVPVSTVTQEDQ